ncbi:MAG TPA: DUF3159 domain-containing protein [Candidatus Limnocylindrales bacterium]
MKGNPGADTEQLPPFGEQMAQQLGGWKGLIESGIPVAVFVLVNVTLGMAWAEGRTREALQWAIGSAVAVAVGIAIVRLLRKESIRFAVNGLFGIALGAYLAWNSGEARDFYLPGIIITIAYAVFLLGSITVGHPLVGWFWAVIAQGGKGDWRSDDRLRRTFGWVTALWAVVFLLKASVQTALYVADYPNALGVARIALGYPPFLMLLAISFWAARRVTREQEPALTQ